MHLFELESLIEIICENEVKTYCKQNEIDYEIDGLDWSDLEEILYDTFDINIEQFESIIKALLPLCDVETSELTGKKYRGFRKDGLWIIKKEY